MKPQSGNPNLKQVTQQGRNAKKQTSSTSSVVTPPPLNSQRNAAQNRSNSPQQKGLNRNSKSRNQQSNNANSDSHLPSLQKNAYQKPPLQQKQQKIIQAAEEQYPFEHINNLIHEYLLKNNMINTLDTFQDELTQPLPPYDQSRGYEFQLMEHFKKGQREQFFLKWNRFLPLSLLVGDEKVTRLEFYLQIFFFIFPIHPFFKRSQGIDQESITIFKEYLDTRGAVLSKTNEFLQYYALPYIPRPQEHPALKHLFTNEWIEGVRYQLNEFLASVYDNQPLPQLFYVYQNYQFSNSSVSGQIENNINPINNNSGSKNNRASSAQNIEMLQNENRELVNVVKQFNEKYMVLQNQNKIVSEQSKQILIESNQKWILTANELVQISKNLRGMIDANRMKGIQFQQEALDSLQNRIDKFESFLNTNLGDLISQSQDLSLFDKQSFMNDNENNQNDFMVNPQPLNFVNAQNFLFHQNNNDPLKYENPYCPLDFNKIKAIIIKQDDPSLCCFLLQALRWRVSKARGAYVRREIVVAYATFDIIGCQNPENLSLQSALFQKNLKIQEFALRLINSMASDFYGRTYLINSNNLAITLIDILRKEKEDSFTRRHALGALQKLSLRRKPQIVMINNDLISWIVKTLRDEKDTLSEYSYEYATALFMNLSLRSSGKLKCEDPNEGVLHVLNDLLEHENMQVKTFVNGTLYSLLGRQSLREQAKAMGMNEILSILKESSDERFTKQIQYIMDQLNKEGDDEDAQSDQNEEDNDVDDIDDEEEVGEDEQTDDYLDNANGIPVGEELLEGQFKLEGQEGMRQQTVTRKIIEETHQNRMLSSANTQVHQNYGAYQRGTLDIPFNRPATPSMSTSYISHSQKTSQNYRTQPSQQQQRNNNNVNRPPLPNQVSNPGSHLEIDSTQNKDSTLNINTNQLEELGRNLPSEMKSRPKILRTPAGGERQRIEQLQKQHEQLLSQSYVEQAISYPSVKKEKTKGKEKTSQQQQQQPQQPQQQQPQQPQQQPPPPEVEQPKSAPSVEVVGPSKASEVQAPVPEIAFESKPKIPRTPPGLQK